MSNNVIVSLDIGTSKVRVIIGEMNNGVFNVIGVGSEDSEGLKNGAIVDIDQTVEAISRAVEHAERMVGISINEVFVGISGNHVDLQTSHGVVAVSSEDREISNIDIDRVLQAAKVIALPPEREIIDVVPKEFIVDGLSGIRDPRGMIGVRLEVYASIITGSKTIIHNLIRTIEKAELQIKGFVLTPLAASKIALSKDEMNLGVVLVDIGKGTTTISVFEQGGLVKSSVIPLGGEYITNDLAIGLRTQKDIAEKVKLKYGIASLFEADEDVKFKVPRIGSNVEKEFTQLDLAHIIEPRIREIFQLINNEVYRLGFTKEIPSGYVLTGGVASMEGILEVAQEELKPAARIAVPNFIGVKDSTYTNGVGTIVYASKKLTNNSGHLKSSTGKAKKKSKGFNSLERIKNWFSEFI